MNTVENINKVKRIRGYGEGSVYQRKDCRWVGKYKDEKMLKPRYVYGKTEAEARRKLREFKKTIVHGITDCRKVLLSTYIERWLYTFKAAAVENTSFDRLESVYYTHIKPTLGGFQLGNIKAVDIQTLLNQKSTEYSYTIVKMIRQILSEVFQHAYTEGDILKNPMANVIMAKRSKFKPERKMLILEDAEVKRLEEAAREKYGTGRPLFVHGNLIVFMLHTGLRCGELLALEWSDIDFESKTVSINKNLAKVKNRDTGKDTSKSTLQVKGTKTSSSNRIIPLNSKAINALRELQMIYRQCGIKSKYVACSQKGGFLTNNRMHNLLERMLKHTGIDKPLTIHQLRHTFASRALNAGVSISVVSKWMGHASISTTYNIYIHAMEQERLTALDVLEAM